MPIEHQTPHPDWPRRVAQAYLAEARPPLTPRMAEDLLERLSAAQHGGEAPREAANAALDAFEADLNAVAGPRVVELDAAGVTMGHRSEAGRPLRTFGGQ
ncbi:hypothetical protein [Methylobacterium oryzisoli]|uniref:hypothetical protein n=1 Tax=Methylobacterium oryzisoli TaxID=3385502 RepID=UPI003891B2B7